MNIEIPESVVETATDRFCDIADVDDYRIRNPREAVLAALQAALAELLEPVGFSDRRARELVASPGGCVLSFRNILVRDPDENYTECHYRIRGQ